MILVKFSDDWADEFRVDGFQVMTDEEFAEWEDKLKRVNWNMEYYFGTNESLEYRDLNDYKKRIRAVPISDEESKMICWLFGAQYGQFVDPVDYEQLEDGL